MDSNTVIRLRRVVLNLARQLNAASREEGLTPTQASVLGITTVRGPLSLAELTELEGINPTMLSRVIGKLDEYGLINRLRDPDDFRAARVEVTPKGRGRLRADHGAAQRGDLRIGVAACPTASRPRCSRRCRRWRTWPRTCGTRCGAAGTGSGTRRGPS